MLYSFAQFNNYALINNVRNIVIRSVWTNTIHTDIPKKKSERKKRMNRNSRRKWSRQGRRQEEKEGNKIDV